MATGCRAVICKNLFVVSGIEALPSTRLYEAYFEKQWGAKKVSLKLGQFAADSEFFNTKYTDVLTNASMGWPAITSLDLPAADRRRLWPPGGAGLRSST